jgi:hypothetical protein
MNDKCQHFTYTYAIKTIGRTYRKIVTYRDSLFRPVRRWTGFGRIQSCSSPAPAQRRSESEERSEVKSL